MKQIKLIMALITALLILPACSSDDDTTTAYYYYYNEPISIRLDNTKMYVVLRDLSDSSNSTDPDLSRYNYVGHIVNKSDGIGAFLSDDRWELITIEDVTIDGTPLSPYIYVSLKDASDLSHLIILGKKIGWTICGSLSWDENVKIMCALPGSKVRSLGASCYIYENGDFNYVDPGFIIKFDFDI